VGGFSRFTFHEIRFTVSSVCLCCGVPIRRHLERTMSTTDFFDLWLHVLALATYGGATLAVVALLLPAANGMADPAARRTVLSRGLRVYDPLAIAALGVLVMTGAFNLTAYKDALRGEFFARMGWLLVWKLVLAFAVVMVGTYITFGLAHRIVRSELLEDPVDAEWLTSMSRRLTYACVLALALLAFATWLGLELGHLPR
jgi:uncharacterized membrane protein